MNPASCVQSVQLLGDVHQILQCMENSCSAVAVTMALLSEQLDAGKGYAGKCRCMPTYK